jgi:single-strand DNA-binding protein
MAVNNINHVVITGNLTREPELRETGTGKSVCEMRVAVNSSFKQGDKWESKPNYFQVNTWAGLADNCAKYLEKGSGVAVSGRLEWQKWESKDGGINSRVVIVADSVQFLGRANATQKPDMEALKAEAADPPSIPSDDEDIPF